MCPGIINPGPLVPYSQVWDKFVIQHAEFEYRPLCSTSTTGGYVMWGESNPSTPMPLSNIAAVALAHAGAVEFNVWKSAVCRMRKTGPDQRYFCQAVTDPAEWQQGRFRMAALTAVTGGVGSVVCRMTMKFYNPQLNLTDGVGRTLAWQSGGVLTTPTRSANVDNNVVEQILNSAGSGINLSTGAPLKCYVSRPTPSGALPYVCDCPEEGTVEVLTNVAAQNDTAASVPGSLWPVLTATFYNALGQVIVNSAQAAVSWSNDGVTNSGPLRQVNLVDQFVYAIPGAVYMALNQKTPTSANGYVASTLKWISSIAIRNKDANPYGNTVVTLSYSPPAVPLARRAICDPSSSVPPPSPAFHTYTRETADAPAASFTAEDERRRPREDEDREFERLVSLVNAVPRDNPERLEYLTTLLNVRYGAAASPLSSVHQGF